MHIIKFNTGGHNWKLIQSIPIGGDRNRIKKNWRCKNCSINAKQYGEGDLLFVSEKYTEQETLYCKMKQKLKIRRTK